MRHIKNNAVHIASGIFGVLVVAVAIMAWRPMPASCTVICSWTDQTGSGTHFWDSVAVSYNGQKIAATTGQYNANGNVYISTDGGTTWQIMSGAGTHKWMKIVMSPDGTHLAAAAQNADIYTSSDGGTTWTDQTGSGNRAWSSIAMSDDGMRLAATEYAPYSGTTGHIYTSSDGGATWTDQVAAGSHAWQSITSTADGMKLAAGAWTFAYDTFDDVFTSTDGGATWTDQTSAGAHGWQTLASAKDGSVLVATGAAAKIYVSNDWGTTWTTGSLPAIIWNSIDCSADCRYQIVSTNMYVYTSDDYGMTWQLDSNLGRRSWRAVGISGDGTKYVAATTAEDIWTGRPDAAPNMPTSLGGTDVTTGATINNERPTFNFTLSDPETADTVKYEIVVSGSPDYSSPLVDYVSALGPQGSAQFTVGQAAGSGTYAAGSENQELEEGMYYWEVKAIDAYGAVSAYSQATSSTPAFTVEEAPPQPGATDTESQEELREHSGWRPAAYNEMRPPSSFSSGVFGGGGSTPATATPETPSAPQSEQTPPPVQTETVPPQAPLFTKTLKFGMHDPDVLALQKYLNSHGVAVAASGPGSAGQETDYFGAATRQAVIRLQELNSADILAPNGLSKGTGLFGPATVQYVNTHP